MNLFLFQRFEAFARKSTQAAGHFIFQIWRDNQNQWQDTITNWIFCCIRSDPIEGRIKVSLKFLFTRKLISLNSCRPNVWLHQRGTHMVVLNKSTIFGQLTVQSTRLGDLQFSQQKFPVNLAPTNLNIKFTKVIEQLNELKDSNETTLWMKQTSLYTAYSSDEQTNTFKLYKSEWLTTAINLERTNSRQKWMNKSVAQEGLIIEPK